MEKTIKISDNRVMFLDIDETLNGHSRMIREFFIENNELSKTYSLFQSDDYGLNAYTSDDSQFSNLSFEFDVNHPLYFPLLHLLKNDKCLLIDDDDTRKLNEKYLRVYIRDDKIIISFRNNKYESEVNRFRIFIKNIMYDIRSKIDDQGLDTKARLNNFFNEAVTILNEENHQITMEEYVIKQKVLKK